MVRRALVIALAASACSWDLPSQIPCQGNDNCPDGLGCDLVTLQCVAVAGCSSNNGNNNCFNGSPQTPTVTPSGSGATLTWFAGNTPNSASGFAVLRAEFASGPFVVVGKVTPYTTQQSTFTDPGPLNPGEAYWYEVATSWPSDVIGTPSPAVQFTESHWTSRSPMPTGREGLGAAVVNGVIYAVGGYNQTAVATVEAYDLSTDAWTAKAPMPTARAYLAVGVVNGIVYAVGGDNNANPLVDYPTLEAYDPATNTWSTKAPMPTSRFDVAVGVINGILYAVGGESATVGSLATLEAYDPAANSWSTKASMATPRFGAGVGVVNGTLYVVGGTNTTPGVVEAYDPSSNTWTTKAPMPTFRWGFATGVIGSTLYAAGGTQGGGATAAVEAYDPAANAWSTKDAVPSPRVFPGAAVANGLLFAIGGYGASGGASPSVAAFAP